MRPHQCQVQGHDHLPAPAGGTIPDTSQDGVDLLGHLGTLLAHIQLTVDQHSRSFSQARLESFRNVVTLIQIYKQSRIFKVL